MAIGQGWKEGNAENGKNRERIFRGKNADIREMPGCVGDIEIKEGLITSKL